MRQGKEFPPAKYEQLQQVKTVGKKLPADDKEINGRGMNRSGQGKEDNQWL